MSIRLASPPGSSLPDPSPGALAESFELPAELLTRVKDLAAPEDWGDEDAVLQRHLAVHVPLAIEQGRYVWTGTQIVMRAGHLATAAGAGVYMGMARADGNRMALAWAGEQPVAVGALLPADLGAWPVLDPRMEIVVAIDQFRSAQLAGLQRVTQNAAIAGAVEWSIRRGLAAPQIRGEARGYFVPVHLTDRAGPPELVAPIQVQARRIVVRALIEPRSAYASARAVARRREELPTWLRAEEELALGQ